VKYALVTFGCRVNQADSLQLEQQLRQAGASCASPEAADLVIVNSCSVTASADQGTRQTIRRIARDNPACRIVVTGCYATRRPDEIEALPGVVRVVPNARKPAMITELAGAGLLTTAERFDEGDGPCGSRLEPGAGGRTVYFLSVQTGCEESCSYCIIPSTRGPSRSRAVESIQAEIADAAARGYKEVVLTGVHLGSYGRDLSEPTSLVRLLRALDRLASDVRFRISSLEPMDCPPEVVDLVARSGRFAPHFHLPLQHASDAVLRRMRRPYEAGQYRRLVDGIRACMPDAAIGSDVIAGFPGETDADAETLASYLATSPLAALHVFSYSDRPGTVASAMPGKVHGSVIRARGLRLRSIGDELRRRFARSQLGAARQAVTLDDGTVALTDNYLKVRIPEGTPRNAWVRVRITDAGEVIRGELEGAPATSGWRAAAPASEAILPR
jgi:threonylcarbamoyladenosine tRNA methylthiotransferase MtaB